MEPQTYLGLAALTRVAFEGGDLAPIRHQLKTQVTGRSARAGAMMDLSKVEQLRGDAAQGLMWQACALERAAIYRTHRERPGAKTVLVFAAADQMGANTPVEFLLEGSDFNILTCYPEAMAAGDALPDHDVAFCAAPADAPNAEAFRALVGQIADPDVPILNLPERLVKPERDTLPKQFAHVPGMRLPKTARVARNDLQDALRESPEEAPAPEVGAYPFVVRPTGSHAGLGLEKIENGEAFSDYLSFREEAAYFVSEYIDYQSPRDGNYRKYRIVLIDGMPFPCHMAISDQWDLWYMNAKMDRSPVKRREEAAFMDGFQAGFARRHEVAFAALHQIIGLDYFGLDCSEDAEGNLVVFEVDNALIVHDMDCRKTFPYKPAHAARVFAVFEAMLDSQVRKQRKPPIIVGPSADARTSVAAA